MLDKDEYCSIRSSPLQQARCSFTEKGITQERPNKEKTIDHKFIAIAQCRRRWLLASSSILHMQHQSTMVNFLFQRLSIVLPWAAVQAKKILLSRVLSLPNSLPVGLNK